MKWFHFLRLGRWEEGRFGPRAVGSNIPFGPAETEMLEASKWRC